MMENFKKNVEKKVNTRKVNDLVTTGNKILKILYVLFIILLIYVGSLIFKEWKILQIVGKILSIISPLFIGWFIAWLLTPLVDKLSAKKIKRPLAVIIVYLGFLILIYAICAFTLPSLGTQITEIVSAIPGIVSDINKWIDDLFIKLSNLSLENLDAVKESFLKKINAYASGIQKNLPETAINIISGVVSGVGNILLSLIIGFYISFDFKKFSTGFINLFPKRSRRDVQYLLGELNNSLYSFVSGTLWLSLLLFVVSVIGFSLIGLNAPVLMSFICVITNLIPYIGPYLGAAIAGAIGFAESPVIGILTLVFILIVQTIDGNVLQPLVMSKKMNLSPVTIIISLLIFGYFFGIFGMIIATPCVALIKIIYVFLDNKYHFFEYKEKEDSTD